MNTWLDILGFWLLDFGVIVTILLGCVLCLRLLIRNSGSRVLLAWGTWLGVALAVLLTCLPAWPRYEIARLAPWRGREAPLVVTNPLAEAPHFVEAAPTDVEPTSAVPIAAADATELWRLQQVLAIGWLASVGSAGVWIGIGLWQVQRLLWQSTRAPQWIFEELMCIAANGKASADVRVSKRLTSAVALGAIRPAILLPAENATESNRKAIRAALAHEWAHIRHGDLWLLALERLVMPLVATHPLFWWLRRSTRLDQELLADAAAAGSKPVEYAEALVSWAKRPRPRRLAWPRSPCRNVPATFPGE